MFRLSFRRLIKLFMVVATLGFLMTITNTIEPSADESNHGEPQEGHRYRRKDLGRVQDLEDSVAVEQHQGKLKVNQDVVLEDPAKLREAGDVHQMFMMPGKEGDIPGGDREQVAEMKVDKEIEEKKKRLDPQPILQAPQEPKGDKNMKGYLGIPVAVDKEKLSSEDRALYDRGWHDHEFNEYVSNMIPLRRELPSIKLKGCTNKTYDLTKLPDTSVILVFHNEAWSTLLRTVHSIINRSPPELLREVILVDDASDMPHLQQPLEDYLAQIPKARVVRMTKRGGLTKARLAGAAKSKGQVLTYLDSHCECFPGWLEPLLERIALNKNTSVCPVIETIDDNTFTVRESSFLLMGGFGWDLIFYWFDPGQPKKDMRKSEADVLISPTMAGGLFAIHRDFFELIGTYDPQLDFWGGENMELSFKIWMCGGQLEFVPCSHVGHVFRKNSPHKGPGADWSAISRNTARVAEVWLDEYKIVYSAYHANKMQAYGDVSSRRAIRQKLQCKSFDWYLKTVYPERTIPSHAGPFVMHHGNLCLDSQVKANSAKDSKDTKIIAYPCHGMGGTQYFEFNNRGEIFRHKFCLDANDGTHVILFRCHGEEGNQKWDTPADGTVRSSVTQGCLTASAENNLVLELCNPQDPRHIWTLPPDLSKLMEEYRSEHSSLGHPV